MSKVKIYKNLNISKRLKETRQQMNMSQVDLAEQLNVSPAAISQYESGEKKPTIANFLKLAKILEVSTDYLLGDQKEDSKNPQTIQDVFPGLESMSKNDQKHVLDEMKTYYQYLRSKIKG